MNIFKLFDNGEWCSITFRLLGDHLPIHDIETKLDLDADKIIEKGLPVCDNENSAEATTNIWTWELPNRANTIDMEDQLIDFLEVFEPKNEILSDILSHPETRAELFVGYGLPENTQGKFLITHELQLRLAQLQINLSFDLYS
jgi:hypothetical protein